MNTARELCEAFAKVTKTDKSPKVSWHDVMLKHSTEWKGAILPDDVKPGPKKSCFETCQKRAVYEGPSPLEYCEGQAASESLGVPIPHAWLLRDGQVIDPVWGAGDHEYFGMVIPDKYVLETIVRTGCWGSILEAGYLNELINQENAS